MYIFPENLIKVLSRTVLAAVVSTVLLVPIAIVSPIQARIARLAIVLCANALFVVVLSVIARQKVGEVFVAGAT